MDDLYNRMRYYGWGTEFVATWIATQYREVGQLLLARLGYNGSMPDILNHLFLVGANLLQGLLIDDVPLSETAELTKVTPDPWNYIEWLRNIGATSLDKLRSESGFNGGQTPSALLYLVLRHALLQEYFNSSLRLGQQ